MCEASLAFLTTVNVSPGHGELRRDRASSFKTTGWDPPPRSSCGPAGLCPPKHHYQTANEGANQVGSRSWGARLPGNKAPRWPNLDATGRCVCDRPGCCLRHELSLCSSSTCSQGAAHPVWLADRGGPRVDPALRKELVGPSRVLGSASSATDGRETPQLRSASRCRGPSLTKNVSHKGEDMATLRKSPGSARQKFAITATLRLRGASPRRVASPALHRKRSPFDV